MTILATSAAWVLALDFAISLAYEVYRATVKSGTSRHDSPRMLVQSLWIYVAAAAVVALLLAGVGWAVWAGLVLCAGAIGVSIFYYNPKIMMDRRPGLIDWVEDMVFTGLLFVAATLLVLDLLGVAT